MRQITLGKTGITVNFNGFGALPLQRISKSEAVGLLHHATDNGINFFDTARFYTDSEEKLGAAFFDRRDKIIIATKTGAQNAADFEKELATSLRNLQTDYIDLYQFHNPGFCPLPDGKDGLYEAMLRAKTAGKIRHIGITNHRLQVARTAIESGLYETLQFPFSYLSGPLETELTAMCQKADMGFIAMKALAGGLIADAGNAYAFLAKFGYIEPIWGIQKREELEQFLSFQNHEPHLDSAALERMENDRRELAGEFCRGCGYCMPCPAGIEINQCARMSLMLRRSVPELWLTPQWQEKMAKIRECRHCGQCKSRCPYHLNTPKLLAENYADYQTFLPIEK